MRNIAQMGPGSPGEFRLTAQQRQIGSQITNWSCVPASLEYLSYFKLGRTSTPLIQESFRSCSPWMTETSGNQTVPRELMPWNAQSWIAIFGAFQMGLEASVDITNDQQVSNSLVDYLNSNQNEVVFLLRTNNFLRNPGNGHAVAIESANNNFCRLVIPTQPSGNLINDPIWGDYQWVDIFSWFSQILVLREI